MTADAFSWMADVIPDATETPATAELKSLPAQWVCWRYETRNGKQTKPPMLPFAGETQDHIYADHADPATWGDYDQAVAYQEERGYAGVGVVLARGIAGVDLDHCRDKETGEIDPAAMAIVKRLGSYTEISPSLTGLKIFLRCARPVPHGIKKERDGWEIEMYTDRRYFTVTERHLPGTPAILADATEAFHELYNELAGPTGPKARPDVKFSANGHGKPDLDALGIGTAYRALIEHGAPAGSDRSAVDQSVITHLVRLGLDDDQIKAVYDHYPIGTAGKYAEKGRNAEDYLARSIANARAFVSANGRGPAAQDGQDEGPERLGDYGHARALSGLMTGEYRWVRQWKSWLGYRAGRWQPIDSAEIAVDGSERLRTYYAPWIAAAPGKEAFEARAKYAAQTYRYNGMTAALSFLRGWDGFKTEAEAFDTDPWLLNVANGTLDLRTGELLPHDPAHLLTKQAPVAYDPAARPKRWAEHVELFLPDDKIRKQVQRDLGTALVGATLEEMLAIWYGLGANGKSTTARVVMSVLGDYGISAARDLLLRKKHEEHPTALADLAGRRLVFSAEADDGQRLNESLVKDLTGGDRKKARFMYGDFFEFEQTFSIVLFVNHKPVITGTDDGIWRRLRLVPWAYQIPPAERRPQEEVVSELLAEAPAILNWLLDGLRDWQDDPHWIAPAVQAATAAYRKEQDRLGGFVGDCCELGTYYTVTVADLYERYTAYCQTEDEEPLSKRAFGKNLRDRGLETKRATGGAREWHGIRLQRASDA